MKHKNRPTRFRRVSCSHAAPAFPYSNFHKIFRPFVIISCRGGYDPGAYLINISDNVYRRRTGASANSDLNLNLRGAGQSRRNLIHFAGPRGQPSPTQSLDADLRQT